MRHGFWIEINFCFPHYIWCCINIWQKDFPLHAMLSHWALVNSDLTFEFCAFHLLIKWQYSVLKCHQSVPVARDIRARIGITLWLRLCWPLSPILDAHLGSFPLPWALSGGEQGRARASHFPLFLSPFLLMTSPKGTFLLNLPPWLQICWTHTKGPLVLDIDLHSPMPYYI